MKTETLELPLDRHLQTERDRPPALTYRHWCYLVDLVVHGGGCEFTASSMLADLRENVPMAGRIGDIREVTQVMATHWQWAWERKRPDVVRKIEGRRTAQHNK